MPKAPKSLKLPFLKKARAFSRNTRSNQAFYNSSSWRKYSKLFRADNPLCIQCSKEGRTTASEVVDHITPINLGGSRFSEDNLQALCHRCHNSKSAKESHYNRAKTK